jgi:signal transduction histidine kinase
MKLVTKTILYYLLLCVPFILIALLASYLLIKRAVNENLNEEIWNKKRRAEALINTFKEPKEIFFSIDSLSSIKVDTTNGAGYKQKCMLKMDADEDELIWYWELKSYYKSKGVNYLITITEPKFENDDLIESLSKVLLLTIAFLILSFFILNWLVSKKLWRPFYTTLDQLNNYDVKQSRNLDFKNTTTTEFKQLNDAVQKMTEKIKRDFLSQKEFTENASHETQTPLAVIKARLDLLLQSQNLKENDMQQLEVIEHAVAKLSSQNKALLLLAKIENNQFKSTEEVDLENVLNKTLILFEDLITSKNISVNKNVSGNSRMKIDPILADILISNLIQNAVRHNEEGGKIEIELKTHSFSIANSGKPLQIKPEELAERFKKNEGSKESIGLGLSIVKSILDSYNYILEYSYKEGNHIFKIRF